MPQARILLIYIKDWDDRRESSDGLSASSFEVRNGSTTSTSTFWGGETNLYDDAARRTETFSHFNFSYSALASFRMGISGSASFQRAKKSW